MSINLFNMHSINISFIINVLLNKIMSLFSAFVWPPKINSLDSIVLFKRRMGLKPRPAAFRVGAVPLNRIPISSLDSFCSKDKCWVFAPPWPVHFWALVVNLWPSLCSEFHLRMPITLQGFYLRMKTTWYTQVTNNILVTHTFVSHQIHLAHTFESYQLEKPRKNF